ncbi:MAG: NGG1p interacting factor NIF3 [Candidatus Spechtbacteria bacterium]|nr:NGG1p interacting factor NIF3 [Candidatus Spechtbacteria bacterium]
MKLKEIYNLSIQMGIDADPRGRAAVEKGLQNVRAKYEKMDEKEKEYFDRETLINPYSDTRLHFGDPELEIKKIFAGIDIDGDELLLAKHLGDIDACVAHHPRGIALAKLHDVMPLQADVLNQYGVPINVAEALLHTRISEVGRGLSASNHYRALDIARLLQMPYMCTHTVTDSLVFQFLKQRVEGERFGTVGEVLDALLEIPEYRESKKRGMGPEIFSGKRENRAGRVALTEITGGTDGAHDIYEKLAQAGVGTVIAMHQSEKHVKFAEKAHVNVVIAGHMSSDSVGMNLFLDTIEEKGVEIVPCGGLLRVVRTRAF